MLSRGSEWHRWDPHLHTPGTVLNDQFSGQDPWEEYLLSLENQDPPIKSIGITDYYFTDCYEKVVAYKNNGRLQNIDLIFPNIELRLGVAAKKGFVNIHLLVSPDDPDHISEIKRLLKRLNFSAHNDRFDCTREDLIRLGKCTNNDVASDSEALALGATQFKVNFDELRKVYNESEWAKNNVLIAVAGAAGDGTSGVRQASDLTVRQEIEKFSHIIFSSSPAQREFWLGQRQVPRETLRSRYDGCKPCLHGSDSHDHESVGSPDLDRFSWIKGSLEFDSLRQACIDPGNRAYVGDRPPNSAMPSQVISEIALSDADWVNTPVIPLNPGLVAVIGARGSGKTALADMIAVACDAMPASGWDEEMHSASFVARAKPLLGNATAKLTWGGGDVVNRRLDGFNADTLSSYPRARYLSQQFVEDLCSAKGISDGLIREIERVIFESHTHEERQWAIDFSELRDNETARFEKARERESQAIHEISERISTEFEKEALVDTLQTQINQKKKLVEGYIADRGKLALKGTEAQVKRHEALTAAATKVRQKISAFNDQRRSFLTLQDEVRSMKSTRAPELLRQAQARHANSGLSPQQWDDFLLIYKGDVDQALSGYITWADAEIEKLKGAPPPPSTPDTPLIPDSADLDSLPLAPLDAEVERLGSLFGDDRLVKEQFATLSARITDEESRIQALQNKLDDAKEASSRRRGLQRERNEAYQRSFEAVISTQDVLSSLYQPLMQRLSRSPGTLKKLAFTVRRVADVEKWASEAEESLLDRRKRGPFYGRGALVKKAEESLKYAWEEGTASEIQAAMTGFMDQYMGDLLFHAPVAESEHTEYRNWLRKFAHWLFSTSHIHVRYEISYDGVDIKNLSPGTRGVVLLLLYLALDDSDDRPLIIDQPEENLDPKSVFDELVDLFIDAKSKRQVIMVTHNANLVINTDADQIIMAESGPHPSGGLPPITYQAGGLENMVIRQAVCSILEGGEEAFRERSRRLRVRLER